MPRPMIDTLEESFTLGGEPKCTSRHDLNRDSCSFEVTHLFRATCSNFYGLRCAVAATRIQRLIDTNGEYCAHCKRDLPECWTLTPI